jgi:hypothetical protein
MTNVEYMSNIINLVIQIYIIIQINFTTFKHKFCIASLDIEKNINGIIFHVLFCYDSSDFHVHIARNY